MHTDATVAALRDAEARAEAQWACVTCGSVGLALPLDRVSEVVTPNPLTRVPGCGPEVGGLVGFRGRVVTVFDLGVLVGGPAAVSTPDHRLVFLEHSRRLLGLAVEAMVTIAAGQRATVHVEPMGLLQAGDVTGMVTIDDRTFATLDPDHLLARLLA